MGLSYHKSVKLFGNTRLNISKHGGIGISTGVKGARVSVNKQGVRTSVGGHGLYYRKQASWNKLAGKTASCAKPLTEAEIKASPDTLQAYNKEIYNVHGKKALKWFIIMVVAALIAGAFTATIGFWIIFVLDCIIYLLYLIGSVQQMNDCNKKGEIFK